MKKIVKIIKKRETLVETVPEEFVKALERIQNSLYAEIFDFLNDKLDSAGGGIGTPSNLNANMQTALALRDQIIRFLRKNGYYLLIAEFNKKYKLLTELSREYYKAINLDPAFTRRDLQELAKIRDTDINFLVTNDQRVINATYTSLTDSIARNETFRDLAKKLEELQTDTILANGKKLNGLLKRYSSTYAFTAFAKFDRIIQNKKAEQLNLGKWLFSGGLIKDSRKFCRARAGRIFTKKQIDAWENQTWQGKADGPGRSVWEFLGGWNCRHILTPISDEFAEDFASLYRV